MGDPFAGVQLRDSDGDASYLRALVTVMRELGVVEAFGVLLGPPQLAMAPKDAPPETEGERRARLLADERDRIETLLGRSVSDAEFDAMADPGNLR